MTANPPQAPTPTEDGFPTYPGFGSREDILARMQLLDWVSTQLGPSGIEANVGDHVLATDGRILGFGPDSDDVYRRVTEAEPALRNARIVQFTIPSRDR